MHLAIKKCIEKRGNFMPMPVHLFDKSDTFAEREKRLFSLVADSPQPIGFSGTFHKYWFGVLK
jgi:hypothetical protein